MSDHICHTLPPRPDTLGPQQDPCLLLAGHDGPHESGAFLWEYDRECNCRDCQSPDPCDHCYVFYKKPLNTGGKDNG